MTEHGGQSWTRTRARIAGYRMNHPDEPVPDELYRDHAVARLEAVITKTLAESPPLTVRQRNHLAGLLRA